MPKNTQLSAVQISELIGRYQEADSRQKEAGKDREDARNELYAVADAQGQPDAKGSIILIADGKKFVKMARHTVTFIEDRALDLFKTRQVYDKVVTERVVYEFNDEVISQLVAQGKIGLDEIRAITQDKVSFTPRVSDLKDGEDSAV